MTIRRALVTGGSGFIGRWAVARLCELGVEVHAVTHREPPAAGDGVTWHEADLHDATAMRRLLATVRPSHLLHAAWYVEPRDYLTSYDNLRWVGTTLALANAFREAGGERVVGVGTSAEYGPSMSPCREHATPTAPATLYAACKLATFGVLDRWSAQTGVAMAWGRVFNLHGPHEAPSRLVPQLIRAGVTGTAFAMRFHGIFPGRPHVAVLLVPAQRRIHGAARQSGGVDDVESVLGA